MPDDVGPSARILFVSLTNDVASDRIVAEMGRRGAECGVLAPPGAYCASTRFARHRFRLPPHKGSWLGGIALRWRLRQVLRAWPASFVVPLDDVASCLLRGIATSPTTPADIRDILLRSFGRPSGFEACWSRRRLLEAAFRLGIRSPDFHVEEDSDAAVALASRWGYPVVIKREQTSGGHGVTIARDAADLTAAYGAPGGGSGSLSLRLRRGLRNAAQRLAGYPADPDPAPILQRFVEGAPAMRTVFAWKGRVLAGVSFVADQVHPSPVGSSTILRHVEVPEMDRAVEALVAEIGCSGFVSFDFVFDEVTGGAHLIELNARPIAASYLGRLFGHDLGGAFLACLAGREAAIGARQASNCMETRRVALFPRELERDPSGSLLRYGHAIWHDMPMDDPAVVEAYLRRLRSVHPTIAWPDPANEVAVGTPMPQTVAS